MNINKTQGQNLENVRLHVLTPLFCRMLTGYYTQNVESVIDFFSKRFKADSHMPGELLVAP
jgi:hypothetical protein